MPQLPMGSGRASGDGAYVEASREYRLHTRIPLRRGDQVYLLYGTYTNLELLGAQIT